MEKGWNLEYDKNRHHYLLHLSHCSYCFQLLLLTQSSHSLPHCCFLLQMLRYLMNHSILKEQVSDLGLHSQVMGFQRHRERMEVIRKQNQLHICQWSRTGFVLLNSRSLSHLSPSSNLALVVN